MDEEGSYSNATNTTALANNAIRSISFQEPQQAIQDALRHLLTLIKEQQASTHELNSQSNDIATRIDALERKYLDARQVQQEFQQQYGAQIDNLVERLAKDNHDLREEMKMMDCRYGQELSTIRETLRLLTHNLGFSPAGDDSDGGDGNNSDGSEKEQKDEETTTEIAEIEGNYRVKDGKMEVTVHSELHVRDIDVGLEHEDIGKEGDDGSVDPPDQEKHPGEIDEQSLTVLAAPSSEKGAIVSKDGIATEPVDEADETNEDDASLNVEDIANDDKTLSTTPLRPDAGQGSTINTAVSKQTLARPTQMNSASRRPS